MSTNLDQSSLTYPACKLWGELDRCVPRGSKNPLSFRLTERMDRAVTRSGFTLQHLSLSADLTHSVASYVCRGMNVPSIDTLERLAAALGVSPGWLAYGYEGSEPFRERYPRPVFPTEDPKPDENLRFFRAHYAGFPARLQAARERSGLSMRTLSTAAGVSVQAWSNAEAGKSVPRVDTAERMAVALGVAPSWLAFGEGSN